MKNMRKFKVTSLILVLAMLVGMIPMGMISAIATETAERTYTLPKTLPDGSEYHSSIFYEGDNYHSAGNNKLTDAWVMADGMLIVMDTYNGSLTSDNNFNMYLQMQAGFASSSSYLRFYTGFTPSLGGKPNTNKNDFQARAGVSYCMKNGVSWIERRLSNDGLGASSIASTTATTAEGYTYVYIPLESFRYFGAGNETYNGYGENENVTLMYDMVGVPLTEFRTLFAEQTLNVQIENYFDKAVTPVVRIDFVYKNEDTSRPTDSVQKLLNLEAKGMDGSYLAKNGDIRALFSGNRLTVTNMPVNSEADDNSVFLKDLYSDACSTDLSKAAGIQLDVDSSALGSASLHLKMNLEMETSPSKVFENNTMILNAMGSKVSYYQDFSDKTSSGIHFATRTGKAVAYVTGTDSAGKTYENAPVYTAGKVTGDSTHSYGPTYNQSGDGAFVLPAGFKGTVYIPMSSYYMNAFGSNNSKMMLPFEYAPVKALDNIGIYSTVGGTPASNKVVYENISIVERTGDVAINNEAEFEAFAKELASGNDFAGKTVTLNADLTFNAGWDAFAEKVTKPSKVYPDMSGVSFAGTFDGQGHTISGLYMTGSSFCGFFGNVASGTKATVKNLDIVNSYIGTKDAQGVGGLFGQVAADAVTSPKLVCYKSQTKAIIENVYMDVNLVNDTSGIFDMGTGGFIGGISSDVSISKSVFAGRVTAGTRGVSAFIGSTAPYVATYNGVANVSFYRMNVQYRDCANLGALVGVDGNQNFLGAIVGYAGGIVENFDVRNFVSTGTISDAKDTLRACDGYLIGGGWASTNGNRVGSRNDETTSSYSDYQHWVLTGVYYTETSGNQFGVIGNTCPAMRVSYATFGGTNTHYTGVNFASANPAKKTMEELPGVLFVRYGEFEQGLILNDGIAISATIDDHDLIAPGDTATVIFGTAGNGKTESAVKENGKYTFALINDILAKDIAKDVNYSILVGDKPVFGTASIYSSLLSILENDNLSDVHALVSDYIRYAKISQEYWKTIASAEELAGSVEVVLPESLKEGSSIEDLVAPNLLSFSMAGPSYGWDPTVRVGEKLALEIGVEADPKGERTYVVMVGDRVAKTERVGETLVVYVYAYEIASEVVVMNDLGFSMTCSAADALLKMLQDDSGVVGDQEKEVLAALGAYCQSVVDFVNS